MSTEIELRDRTGSLLKQAQAIVVTNDEQRAAKGEIVIPGVEVRSETKVQ